MFSAMLSEAFRDDDDGITIRYRTDGKLLNLRRLQAKSKVKETTVRDLLFADESKAIWSRLGRALRINIKDGVSQLHLHVF